VLNRFLKKDKILFNFEARNFSDALRKMLKKSEETGVHEIINQISKREKLMSFITRKNFALPRIVLGHKKNTEVIIAINKKGIKLGQGTEPVKIIVLFLFSPKTDSAALIAQALRIFNDDNLREELIESEKPDEAINLIKEWESE